ncbi:MAG: copper chaperone PCu(A)C [Inquilinus sp.]|nr:copper chaperone PCu(A)C [Inquilinus sp.]
MRPFFRILSAITITLAAGSAAAAEYRAGDITIADPWSRATAPAARTGAGFMTIGNGGSADDRLIAAATEAAGRVELHRSVMQDGVMRMIEQEDGIPVPAGETVILEPGGLHLMMMGLTGPLAKDSRVPVILTFERAGTVVVELAVGAAGSAMAPMGHGAAGHGN